MLCLNSRKKKKYFQFTAGSKSLYQKGKSKIVSGPTSWTILFVVFAGKAGVNYMGQQVMTYWTNAKILFAFIESTQSDKTKGTAMNSAVRNVESPILIV